MNTDAILSLGKRHEEFSATVNEDEINLKEIVRLLWIGRWLILGVALVSASIAFVGVSLTPKRYEAKVLLSPVTQDASSEHGGGFSSLVSQLGGLASVAGLTGSESGFKAEALATLQSEALTEQYVQQNNLLPILYAKKWDSQKLAWTTTGPKQIPTLWKANQLFFKKIRTVLENPKTGLAVLTITWTDPKLAAQWANGLVKMTNLYLRDKAIAEGDRRIAYLKKEVANTNVVELQQAIYSLMESEINKEMLARGSDEYALKIIDPAAIPEEAAWPIKLVWTSVAFSVGLLLSIGVVIARGRPKAAAR